VEDVKSNYSWNDRYHKSLFESLLSKILFNHRFYEIVNQFKLEFENLSVVHLRIEGDIIIHWASANDIIWHDSEGIKRTRDRLYKLYIDNIKQYIDGNLLILCYNIDPHFVEGLQSIMETNYNNSEEDNTKSEESNVQNEKTGKPKESSEITSKPILKRIISINTIIKNNYLIQKFGFTGREICGIIDLLLGQKCEGDYIGSYNIENNRGSTFSYVLHHIGNHKRSILIDAHRLFDNDKPEVFHSRK